MKLNKEIPGEEARPDVKAHGNALKDAFDMVDSLRVKMHAEIGKVISEIDSIRQEKPVHRYYLELPIELLEAEVNVIMPPTNFFDANGKARDLVMDMIYVIKESNDKIYIDSIIAEHRAKISLNGCEDQELGPNTDDAQFSFTIHDLNNPARPIGLQATVSSKSIEICSRFDNFSTEQKQLTFLLLAESVYQAAQHYVSQSPEV